MDDNKVIEYLESRITKNPKSLLFARLADNYIARGRIDEAIQICRSGIKNHPEYITGYLILSKAYLVKEDFEKAETELKRVLSRDRYYIAAHKLLADLMVKMGWENTAAMHYKDIIKIDPLNKEAINCVAKLNISDLSTPVEELHIEPDFLEEEPPADLNPLKHHEKDVLLDELEEVFSASDEETQDEPDFTKKEQPSFWPEDLEKETDENIKSEALEVEGSKEVAIDIDIQSDVMIDSIAPVTVTSNEITDTSDDSLLDFELPDDEPAEVELDVQSSEETSEDSSNETLQDLDDFTIETPATENLEEDLLDIDLSDEEDEKQEENLSSSIESVFKDVTPITESLEDTPEESEEIIKPKVSDDELDDISSMPEFISSEDRLPTDVQTQTHSIKPGTSPAASEEESEDKNKETEELADKILEQDIEDISETELVEPKNTTTEQDLSLTEDNDSLNINDSETESEKLEEIELSVEEPTETLTQDETEAIELELSKKAQPKGDATTSQELQESETDNLQQVETKAAADTENEIDIKQEPQQVEEGAKAESSVEVETDKESQSKPSDHSETEAQIFEPELMSDTSIGEEIETPESKSFIGEEDFEIDDSAEALITEAKETEKEQAALKGQFLSDDDDFDFSLEILEEIDRHIEEASKVAKESIQDEDKDQQDEAPPPPPSPQGAENSEEQTESPQEEITQPEESKSSGKESKIVSPTLGEIYVAQGEYAKAIKVYEVLLEKNPDEKKYHKKIEELKQKLDSAEQSS